MELESPSAAIVATDRAATTGLFDKYRLHATPSPRYGLGSTNGASVSAIGAPYEHRQAVMRAAELHSLLSCSRRTFAVGPLSHEAVLLSQCLTVVLLSPTCPAICPAESPASSSGLSTSRATPPRARYLAWPVAWRPCLLTQYPTVDSWRPKRRPISASDRLCCSSCSRDARSTPQVSLLGCHVAVRNVTASCRFCDGSVTTVGRPYRSPVFSSTWE